MKRKAAKKRAMVYQYTAIFEPDTERGGYTVSIPSLPGCISEGDTFEEALGHIKEAAELYLEVMEKHRRDVPRGDSGVIVTPIRIHARV